MKIHCNTDSVTNGNKYEKLPLRNAILFWSGPYKDGGTVPNMEFSDNSRALFDYMLSKKLNEHWELIWLVSNPHKYHAKYRGVKNVRFLSAKSAESDIEEIRDEYFSVLYSVRYIFTTDGYGFASNIRKGQTRIQLWHGCGIKTRVHFGRMEHNYEFMTVSSKFYQQRHAKIFGLRSDQVLLTGLPKNDLLFHPIENWQDQLDIPYHKKYIFWLPTFRTTYLKDMAHLNEDINIHSKTGLPIVYTAEQIEYLETLLAKYDMCLIIKLHPFQKRENIFLENRRHIKILENSVLEENLLQMEHVLGHANALISDYSSAAISYCILDRPLAFTLDDCDAYGTHRGFHWDNVRDYLPGIEIYTFDDFCRFVQDIAEDRDRSYKKRKRLMPTFHQYRDDKSSARILSYFEIVKE